jgi:RelE-like toxin of type II toxin-antitoxin system HigB
MRSPPTSADLVAILLSGFSHQDRALRKLRQLDAAATVEDLRNPPGNRLETLKRDRAGQMSIRINDIRNIDSDHLKHHGRQDAQIKSI